MKTVTTLLTSLFICIIISLQGNEAVNQLCGLPTDSCMNDENWNHCLDLVETGCVVQKDPSSCPYEYQCLGPQVIDDDQDYHLHIRTTNKDSLEKKKPNACASLLVYKDKECTGSPIRSLTFPTWTTPGSRCCK